MSKYALLVIDMQSAYFNNDALEQQRTALVKACNELIMLAVRQNIPVINIVTQHLRDKTTWTLNMLDDGEGYLFEGDEETAVVDGLKLTGSLGVVKTRDSAFHGTQLNSLLQEKGIEGVILAGVSTHSCIMQTAADAYAHNLRVILARDAIASHDPDFEEMTYGLLVQEYRQKICTHEEIANMVSSHI